MNIDCRKSSQEAIAQQRDSFVAKGDVDVGRRLRGDIYITGYINQTNGDDKLALVDFIDLLKHPKRGGKEEKKQKREELLIIDER